MQPLTLYIADEDYDKVIQALSFHGANLSAPVSATEERAVDTLMKVVMSIAEDYERRSYFEGFVFVPPGVANPRPWKQPEGAHDAYDSVGRPVNIVRHQGKIWESDVPNNVWEPGVYGWTEI